MNRYIYFGETVKGYDVPVLNEREARAGAGLLFIFAMVSFLNSYLLHDFSFTKTFVTLFMVDFFIRIFINPKYAPSLILGRIFVQNQTPEYVGAAQKKFAWYIGFILSVIMFFMIVIFEIMTPIKIIICLLCLALLFSESAFGICLGCIVYHWIYKKSPHYCPGNVCEVIQKEEIQKVSKLQLVIISIFSLSLMSYAVINLNQTEVIKIQTMKCEAGKCGSGM